VACFVGENSYKPSSQDYVLLKTLYVEYREFCLEDGASALKKSNFKRRLELNGFEVRQMNDGNRVYLEVSSRSQLS
jgi:putative DNA primase/helicase